MLHDLLYRDVHARDTREAILLVEVTRAAPVKGKDGRARPRTRVRASTEYAVNGDIIDFETFDIETRFRRNPVILDCHSSTPGMCGGPPPTILGRGVDPVLEERWFDVTIEWDDQVDRAAQWHRQFDEGFANCVSIGFAAPRKHKVRRDTLPADHRHYVAPDPEGKAHPGFLLRHCVLYEVSPVPLPADPDAMAQRGYVSRSWGARADAMVRGALRDDKLRAAIVEELAADLRELVRSEIDHLEPRALATSPLLTIIREMVGKDLRAHVRAELASVHEEQAASALARSPMLRALAARG